MTTTNKHSTFEKTVLAAAAALLLRPAAACGQDASGETDEADPLNAVVKLEVQTSEPDFELPWRTDIGGGDGSGVVIAPGLVLTCAHCVADATYIRIRKNNEDSLYHGEIEAIDNDCDLALVRVADGAFMDGVTPMGIGETPPVQADVLAVGYPRGGDGISFTRGIVSRVEDMTYLQALTTLLAAQVDAAINPGNSGGPVLDLQTGLVAGIAFQGDSRGESLGYMIPTEIVRRFLEDVADGSVAGVPALPFVAGTLENPATRRSLGMAPDQTGVYVEHVNGDTNKCPVRVGDVIMGIGGYNVANNGNIRIEGNKIRSMAYPFYLRQVGDSVPVTIMRGGETLLLDVPVEKRNRKARDFLTGRAPDYYVFGGLVFTTATLNYIVDVRPAVNDDIAGEKEFPEEESVMICAVLPDVCVEGYLGVGESHVRSVNGIPVKNLRHLVETIESADGEFLRLALDNGDEWDLPMVLDMALAREATQRVLERYRIPADRNLD